jgi:hypothetical protein
MFFQTCELSVQRTAGCFVGSRLHHRRFDFFDHQPRKLGPERVLLSLSPLRFLDTSFGFIEVLSRFTIRGGTEEK